MKCLLDESFIYSNNECSHYHHIFPTNEYSPENKENNDLLINDIYCLNSAPIRKVSKTNQNVSYPLQMIINFSANIAKFNKIINKSTIIHNRGDLSKKKTFVEHHTENNEFGNFIAYEDYMVKCCFHDRTLVTIDSNEEFISILSKKGEQIIENLNNLKKNEFSWYLNYIIINLKLFFLRYIGMALEFKKNAFLSEEEKKSREKLEKERVEVINFELEKNNRFLAIINKKVPNENTEIIHNVFVEKEEKCYNVEE